MSTGEGGNGPAARDAGSPPAASSTVADDDDETTGDGTVDYYDVMNVDEIDDDDCDGDEDPIDYYSDDGDVIDETELEIDGDGATAIEEPAEQRYVVLSHDDIRARQEADIAAIAEVLSVPAGFAAVLLRHYNWRAMRVQEEWFSDDRRVRAAVGLPSPDSNNGGGALVPTALSRSRRRCGICFGSFPAGGSRSAACGAHFYCDPCWRGYLRAAVHDGPRCLSLRCPDPSCSAAVVQELVDEVAGAAGDGIRRRYARFALWSFVDESGGRVRWCLMT